MKNKIITLVIAFLFIAVHLPSLGSDNFTTDTWKWKARSYDFGSGVFGLQFEKTIQKYHPGVTLMWLCTMGIKVVNAYNKVFTGGLPPDNSLKFVFELDFIQKLFIISAISIVISSIFQALCYYYPKKVSFFLVSILTLEPLFLGLSRVIHLEGLMSSFLLASVIWLFVYIYPPAPLTASNEQNVSENKKFLVYSAIFGALSVLTKTSAIFVIPFTLLMLLIRYFSKPKDILKTVMLPFVFWIACVILVFVSLWPVMWVNPVWALQELLRGVQVIGVEREHIQIYFGQIVDDPGPLFYLVVLGLRISMWTLAGAIGFLLAYRKLPGSHKKLGIYLLLFTLLYTLELSIPSKKLDRYILPAILSLSLISGIFFSWFVFQFSPKIRAIIVSFIFAISLLTVTNLHPDYLAYYNPLFGGLESGIFILEPKWMIGKNELISYFRELHRSEGFVLAKPDIPLEEAISNGDVKKNLAIAFPEKYYTQIWPFIKNEQFWPVIMDLGPQAKYCKYFVYPVWEDTSKEETRFSLKFVGTVKKQGVALYNVYQRN